MEKILSITECRFVIAENNSQVNKILGLNDKLPHLEKIITFDTEDDVKQEVKDYYNEWMYIFNHHFTEREYLMLDGMLEPIYSNTFNYEPIQNILKKNYLVPKDDDLEYDYRQIIDDIFLLGVEFY